MTYMIIYGHEIELEISPIREYLYSLVQCWKSNIHTSTNAVLVPDIQEVKYDMFMITCKPTTSTCS